jgi:hypothetical protein
MKKLYHAEKKDLEFHDGGEIGEIGEKDEGEKVRRVEGWKGWHWSVVIVGKGKR